MAKLLCLICRKKLEINTRTVPLEGMFCSRKCADQLEHYITSIVDSFSSHELPQTVLDLRELKEEARKKRWSGRKQ